jgi:hypothetical protein
MAAVGLGIAVGRGALELICDCWGLSILKLHRVTISSERGTAGREGTGRATQQ